MVIKREELTFYRKLGQVAMPRKVHMAMVHHSKHPPLEFTQIRKLKVQPAGFFFVNTPRNCHIRGSPPKRTKIFTRPSTTRFRRQPKADIRKPTSESRQPQADSRKPTAASRQPQAGCLYQGSSNQCDVVMVNRPKIPSLAHITNLVKRS